jgi:transposase InsO family protein
MLLEVRVVRIVAAVARYRAGAVTCLEAASLLGMSERHFRRVRDRYEKEGLEGLADRRVGKLSGRRAPVDEVTKVLGLFETRYFDFRVKHFHEVLVREHAVGRSYTWVKNVLQAAGKVARAAKRSAHRKRRARRPQEGMMLFQDGSRFRWVAALEETYDLVATMDDATGKLYSAFLVAEEGTMSSFEGLLEVIADHGLFGEFYTDRGSHYFLTPKAGGKVAKEQPTQVGRALAQLGIQHIASYSPQARGRMERVFGTLQGRLPPELRVAGIATVADANRYIRERFLPAFNAQFAVRPEDPAPAFIPYVGRPIADILCVQEERIVGNDNTVRWHGRVLQIPPSSLRPHFVKAVVRVHAYSDGRLALFHGPRCIGRYDAEGRPEKDKPDQAPLSTAA